jgi:hypothetical protein
MRHKTARPGLVLLVVLGVLVASPISVHASHICMADGVCVPDDPGQALPPEVLPEGSDPVPPILPEEGVAGEVTALDEAEDAVVNNPYVEHAVLCEITADIPFRDGNKIYGVGRRSCNSDLDVANMTVQLQRLEAGVWKNYGTPVTSSSTAAKIALTLILQRFRLESGSG